MHCVYTITDYKTIINYKLMRYFILMLAICTCMMACQQQAGQGTTQETTTEIVSLSPSDFQAKMTSLKDAVLLDVRTPEEVAESKINGAVAIDFYADDFKEALQKQLSGEQPVLVYCRSGGRSMKACKLLQSFNKKGVYNLEGGITAWQKAGLEILQK